MTVLQSREEVRTHCVILKERKSVFSQTNVQVRKRERKGSFSHNDRISDIVIALSSIVPKVLV